jgi:hypothetical protein
MSLTIQLNIFSAEKKITFTKSPFSSLGKFDLVRLSYFSQWKILPADSSGKKETNYEKFEN